MTAGFLALVSSPAAGGQQNVKSGSKTSSHTDDRIGTVNIKSRYKRCQAASRTGSPGSLGSSLEILADKTAQRKWGLKGSTLNTDTPNWHRRTNGFNKGKLTPCLWKLHLKAPWRLRLTSNQLVRRDGHSGTRCHSHYIVWLTFMTKHQSKKTRLWSV